MSAGPQSAGRTASRARARSVGWRRQPDTGTPRLRQADGNRLLRRAGAVLALPHVLHFLSHELACLRARRFALPLVAAGSRQRSLLRHWFPPGGTILGGGPEFSPDPPDV